MQRIIATIVLAAGLALLPVAARGAGERAACLDACHAEAEACEAQRCGVGEPPVDSTCGRVCGDRHKQCKASCPQ